MEEYVYLHAELRRLDKLGCGNMTAQHRGRLFERLLHELLETSDLKPRRNQRPKGEETDGSFIHEGRSFILESKWLASPVSESQILAFRGTVEGKLEGTLGVFVSMSGYSPDAVMALQKGKSLNVLLFDRSDVEDSIDHDFVEVLSHKLREASERGDIHAHYRSRRLPSESRRHRKASREYVVLLEDEREEEIAQAIVYKLAHNELAFFEFKGGVGRTEVVASARYLTEEYNVLALYDEQSLPHGDAKLLREMPYATLIDVPGGVNRWRSALPENSVNLDLDLLTAHYPGLSAFLRLAQAETDRLANADK
ncbi:restriction endonuclease [Streptomyces violaceusniger]|uniref:restriction endonuclease n=1 Tax=Streptomyces violaceusniger TaxID=68280 RepID=UPI003811D29A